MEAVWGFYGPWLGLMLQVGLPLLVLGTPAIFLFERGSFLRWMTGQLALWGWDLVRLSAALYFIILLLQDMSAEVPGT